MRYKRVNNFAKKTTSFETSISNVFTVKSKCMYCLTNFKSVYRKYSTLFDDLESLKDNKEYGCYIFDDIIRFPDDVRFRKKSTPIKVNTQIVGKSVSLKNTSTSSDSRGRFNYQVYCKCSRTCWVIPSEKLPKRAEKTVKLKSKFIFV